MSDQYVEATEANDGIVVLKVTIPHLREAPVCYGVRDQMIARVDPERTNRVVIDLKDVNFIGSVGLLAFLALRRTLASGQIVLCNLEASIREMLILCQLISPDGDGKSPFEVRDSLEEAIAALSG